MQISEQLIQRVLSDNATPEEKEMVLAYLKSNPGKMAQYMTQESWESFVPGDQQQAPQSKLLAALEAHAGKAPVKTLWYKWAAAAAAVIIIAGTSALFYLKGNKEENIAVVTSSVHEEKPMESFKNLTTAVKKYTLTDGTTIKLGSNSILRFHHPFINNRRDVYLIGEATFIVAKDKTKPFIVHSSHITTTALGTVFSVNDKRNATATIHLYEGKIVVKSADSLSQFKDVYLVPGQELVLNKTDFTTHLKNIPGKPVIPLCEVIHVETAPVQVTFSKIPLPKLLDQLAEKMKVEITYDPVYIQNMDFTGTFDSKKESLASFLGTLCDLNELKLTQLNSKHFSIAVK